MPTLAVRSSESTFPGSHNPGRTGPRAGTLPGFDAGHLIWLAVIVARVVAIQASRDSQEAGLGVGCHKKPRESLQAPLVLPPGGLLLRGTDADRPLAGVATWPGSLC